MKKKLQRNQKRTFLEHLRELKIRLTFWLIVFILFSFLGYFFNSKILNILLIPLKQPLYYSNPAGGFSFIFSLSFFFGFIITIPLLIYELLAFVEPVIPVKIRYSTLTVLFSSCVLMIMGIVFAYYVSLPATLHFLAKFGAGDIKSLISASEYFSFVSRYMIGFGILFQLPLVMFFINKVKKLSVKKLLLSEHWVILTSFIIAAIITPTPDIINQLVMAIPIIILYQFSILLIYIANH